MHSPAPRGPQGSRLGITEWGSVGRGQVCRGFPGSSVVKESACSAGDLASIPGSGISPGEGSGYPLQHSCLENSMDRRAWRATVHGVAKSRTQLNAQVCRVLRVRRGHLRTHPRRQRDHLRARQARSNHSIVPSDPTRHPLKDKMTTNYKMANVMS